MITATPSANQSLNINEASKSCGLSPSVLRIWELRYGWPNPKRKPNGYRAYNVHQVQELKRVATLVKAGTPISSIIVDGLPRWPTDQTRAPALRTLARTRALAPAASGTAAGLQRDLIEALETRRGPLVKELLQRIFWSVRPSDEPHVALVPALTALAELQLADRPFPEAAEVRAMLLDRCSQLLRMLKLQEEPLLVVPATPEDQALASLTALILCYRGTPAKPLPHGTLPTGTCITVGDQMVSGLEDSRLAQVTILGGEGLASLQDILDGELSWSRRVATA